MMGSLRTLRDRQGAFDDALDRSVGEPPDGAARIAVSIFNGGAMGTSGGLYYLGHPVQLNGPEIEGGSFSPIIDTATTVVVDVLGQAPSVGDILVATGVGGRWVAEKGAGGGCCCYWVCTDPGRGVLASPSSLALVDSEFGTTVLGRAGCQSGCLNGRTGFFCAWSGSTWINYKGANGCASINTVVLRGPGAPGFAAGDNLTLYDGAGKVQTVALVAPPYFVPSSNVTILTVSAQYPAITGFLYDSTKITPTAVDPSSSGNTVVLAGDQTGTYSRGDSVFLIGSKNEAAIVPVAAAPSYDPMADKTTFSVTGAITFKIASVFDGTLNPSYASSFTWNGFQLCYFVGCWSLKDLLLTVTGNPTGGTFTLAFGSDVTGPLPFDASASAIQTALTGLTSIGAGNATVSGASPEWTITLNTALLGNFVVNYSGLTGCPTAPFCQMSTSLKPPGYTTYSALWMNWAINYPGSGGPVVSDYCPAGASATVQTVDVGDASAGGFTLGVDGFETMTAEIHYDASADDVETALNDLMGPGSVSVSGDSPTWTVTFTGEAYPVPKMTGVKLFTGSSPLSISVVNPGRAGNAAPCTAPAGPRRSPRRSPTR
jgi:hypothetical protein